MKLCLGTVQLGMDYGIRGKKRPTLEEALGIIDFAIHNGIGTIDTANAYGEAEDVVGAYLERNPAVRGQIQLISKFRPNLLDDVPPAQYYPIMKENLRESLRRLHMDYLEGYLLHSARYVFDDEIIDALKRLKAEGYVEKIGVSVYEVEEAKAGIQRGDLDFLQLPYSALDQRMLHSGVFSMAVERGFPLHSRSAFIQGLVLMEEPEVPAFLERAKPLVGKISLLCKEAGLTRVQLAMGYVKRQEAVSHLVFGVRNTEQLRENIDAFSYDLPQDVYDELERQFAQVEADIVMPSLWKRQG